MIGHVTFRTNDLACAAAFYDTLAAELGNGRMTEGERYIGWVVPGGTPGIGLTRPFDGRPATVDNGVRIALAAKDRAQVDRLHALAMAHGGTDERAPAERFPGFCAAYFRDPGSNKLNAFTIGDPT